MILVTIHRAVDVIMANIGRRRPPGVFSLSGGQTARCSLVPARLEPGDVHIDAVAMDARRDRVEEGARIAARRDADARGEPRGGEGTGSADRRARVRQGVDTLAHDLDIAMRRPPRGHARRKAVAIARERRSRGYLEAIAFAQDDRAEAAHLGMEQS